MKTSDFYFDLPQELIAQDPLLDRSSSRLLALDKESGAVSHHTFTDVLDYLKEGDCLVLNNTKVMPARLFGIKEDTGGKVEVLLLKRKDKDVWETLVKPGRKCRPGARLDFGDGLLKGEVLEVVEEGNRLKGFGGAKEDGKVDGNGKLVVNKEDLSWRVDMNTRDWGFEKS